MICNKCKKDNSEGSLFCIACGNHIAQKCTCGKISEFGVRFCSNCGKSFFQSETVSKESITTEKNVLSNTHTGIPVEKHEDIPEKNTVDVKVKETSQELVEKKQNEKNNKKKNHVEFIKPKGRGFVYVPGDYAYAQCVKKEEKTYRFKCIDNYSYFNLSTKYIAENFKEKIEKGTYIWVMLKEVISQKNTCLYKVYVPSQSLIKIEIEEFIKIHKVGDIVKAPIKKIENEFLYVSLTPTYTSRITCKKQALFNYKQGDIVDVVIDSINNLEGKIKITVRILNNEELIDRFLWNMLPTPSLKGNVFFPESLKGVMNDRNYWKLFNAEKNSSFFSIFNPIYTKRYASKQITTHQTSKYYYMEFDTGKKDEQGVPVFVCFKKDRNKEKEKWICNLIGFTSAEYEFEKYVYIKDWKSLLDKLSAQTLKGEQWDLPGDKEKDKKFILKQYIRFTYYKARLDNLIIENEHGAIFNTGLVDNTYDDIFCYLKHNESPDFYERKWEFGFFATWGRNEGKELNRWFNQKPNSPEYIKNLQDVFYDVSKELSCDYEHIINDNLKRVPVEFLIESLNNYKNILDKLDEYQKNPFNTACFNEIVTCIRENDSAFRELVGDFKDAVRKAQKYCKWNYKTAIPIYYPRINAISLLLPLCLSRKNDNVADVALVIEKLPSGNYQG